MSDLFESLEPITLSPSQSLPLRRMIEALKADDSLYSACPKIVQTAIAEFMLPPYSSAEKHIATLEDCIEDNLKLLEKFARRIKELEARELELKRLARTAIDAMRVHT